MAASKIILMGATGFVGSEVLSQLLDRPEVEEVTCLVRKPVTITSPKLKTLLHRDFTVYEEALARKLADHSACIWALGGKVTDNSHVQRYFFERVTHTFTLAFARAVGAHLSKPFHFCYLSGMGADPSEKSRFPWQKATRHLKGRTERDLEQFTKHQPLFRSTSFRPAGILPRSTNSAINFILAPISIRVDRLANALIDEAIGETSFGTEPYRMLSNRMIRGMRRGINSRSSVALR